MFAWFGNVPILLFCFIYVREKHTQLPAIQLYLQLNDIEALIDGLIDWLIDIFILYKTFQTHVLVCT